jgi:hypothetical protein
MAAAEDKGGKPNPGTKPDRRLGENNRSSGSKPASRGGSKPKR